MESDTATNAHVDLAAASAFMTAHARLLDRRRFAVRMGLAAWPSGPLQALDAYRNPDGGYGWGLEPDLRAPESQPGAALHAFEVFEDVAPATSPAPPSCATGWRPPPSPTADCPSACPSPTPPPRRRSGPGRPDRVVAAHNRRRHRGRPRVARHDPAVAGHDWLARATRYCLDTIAARDEPESTLELFYALDFLDAIADHEPEAGPLIERLAAAIPASGILHVEGGLEDEVIRPLEFAPRPDRPLRRHLAPGVVEADLARLAGEQRPDGGWDIDFHPYSPAAGLEWRGYATVHSLAVLRDNGVVASP